MEKIIQVSCQRKEIISRMSLCMPSIEYELYGEEYDYDIKLLRINDADFIAVSELFADVTYGNGEMGLAETLVSLLEDSGLNIATAESCTGGMLASSIVDIDGASAVFYEGLITYSNNAKIDRLAVDINTLYEYGAVSEETAIEMANGLLKSNVAIGVSITGIAGPQGGSYEKPVGLVYIAIVSEKHTDIYKNVFVGNRIQIRQQAKNTALYYTIQHIINNF